MKSILSASQNTILICLMLLTLVHFSQAQSTRKNDVIITKDNEKIEAVIQEIDASTVRYKKVSDPDGPVFTLNKTDISSITYGNGETERFNNKATSEYFAPGSVPPPVIYKTETEVPAKNSNGLFSGSRSDQLRNNYNLYTKKARSYKKLGFIAASAGLLFTVIGAVKISDAENYYNSYGYYVSDNDAAVGALLFTAGLGAGIPLTIIGFIKNKKYTKKAVEVQNELRRRNQPLSFRLNPGFNPKTSSGYLSLVMTF